MIKVDIIGRLGNQMFQYAFAYATAKQFKTFFVINPTTQFDVAKYFRLDPLTSFFYGAPVNKYIIKIFSKFGSRLYYRKKIEENEATSTVSQEASGAYIGYFQSEKYFHEYRHDISRCFSIKEKWKQPFIDKYGKMLKNNKTIVIHVRRTDYLEFGKDFLGEKDLSLPITYYKNCFSRISNPEQYKILCISDDINFVRENLNIEGDLSFESNDMITDFQLLQHADIAIIANSTFAWWAAYLNNKAEKVFAPKYWLGFKVDVEYPVDIIPQRFEAIDVY